MTIIGNNSILFGNPVGISWNYENIGKRHILIACELRNTGKRIMLIEVRDSQTGYLIPARDGPGALPDGQSCWDVVVAVVPMSQCPSVPMSQTLKMVGFPVFPSSQVIKMVHVPVFLSSQLIKMDRCLIC